MLSLCLSLAACGGGRAKERDRPAPTVRVAAVAPHRFVDRIEAVGTANANEQVTLAAPVTERIMRLNFDDGQYIRAGQVIAVLAQGQENASLAEAHAREREASQQLGRLQALKARGFATNAAVDTQVALESAARAQGANARASIGDRVVTAPFSGWVSLRTISAGAVVTAGTAIATISDVSRIKLDFTVPETMLAAIAPGQTIDAVAAAYPGQPFRGRIETIDPVLDPASRAAKVRAILPNPDRRLRPGMLLTVRIEAATRVAPAVPELALVGDGDDRFVYVVGRDGKVARTPVKTGLQADGLVEITQGLRPGQRVVTEGVVKLTDGMAVRLAGARQGKGG